MGDRWSLTFAVMASLATAPATAQTVSPLPTVVQLPSIQQFSYTGTVLVPDSAAGYRAGVFLGGVKRSSSGYVQRGLRRSSGEVLGHSGATLSSTIIDHQEIDRRIRGATGTEPASRLQRATIVAADPADEGKSLVRYARRRYRQGDRSGAYVAYKMAIEKLDGRLRRLAIAEFRRVFGQVDRASL